MTQTVNNSSQEVLSNPEWNLEIEEPKKKAPQEKENLRNFYKSNIDVFYRIFYTSIYGIFAAYFAWATYYFLTYSNENFCSTTCNGFGFLLVLFAIINLWIIYKGIKRYSPSLWNRIVPLKQLQQLTDEKCVKIIFYMLILIGIIFYLIYNSYHDLSRLMPLVGLLVFLLFGFIFSTDPYRINWQPVIWGLLLQFFFGLMTISWETGRNVLICMGNKTTIFLRYALTGSSFVYSDFLVHEKGVFVFQALSAGFFLCFIVNILYHYGIIQKVIIAVGSILQCIMGTTLCESVNSAANILLSMTESPMLISPYLKDLTKSEIHSIMASGFATVAGSTMAAYIAFGANAQHLITASIMSAPAALCFSKLFCPETETTVVTKGTIKLLKSEYASALDAGCKGVTMAIQIVLGVAGNLVAFIAFISFLNGTAAWMGSLVGFEGEQEWSVEKTVGYFFIPISYIMGVPWDECGKVGRLIGIKTIVNEFVAYKEMSTMVLSERAKVIATYALCGFSNPGSIGITISTLSVLMPTKKEMVTQMAFRAFISGSIVCFMTACIAALLIPD